MVEMNKMHISTRGDPAMSVVVRYWMLASVLVSVDTALAAQNMRFASIAAEDKLMIVDSVCDRIAKQDHDCVHMVCASDGALYKKWRSIPYGNDTFVIMKEFSLHPAMVKWSLPGVASFRRSILSGDEPLFVYLNEAPMQVLAENRLRNILAERYFPILVPDGVPLVAFVRRQREPLYHQQVLEVFHPELATNYQSDVACSNLWETAVCAVVSNCAFHVEGLAGGASLGSLHQMTDSELKRIDRKNLVARRVAATAPVITLLKREATEMVYVTALCRGVVGSMKEFNKRYVGKGPEFIVELTEPKCETEFGRMLYDAAKKKGLLPKRDGGGGKTTSNGNGKELR